MINFRLDLIKEWLRLGHEVIALAPGQEVKEQLYEFGVKYTEIPIYRTGINPLRDIKLWIKLVRIFRKEKPNYLFLYTIKPVIYGSLAALFVKNCLVYSLITGLGYVFTGNTLKQKILNILVVVLYKLALMRNKKIFFQNPDDASIFKRLKLVRDHNHIIVNGSGVNLKEFRHLPVPNEPITFLLIARLLWDKGINEYVEAARHIKKNYPDTRFLLVGPFDENPSAVTEKEVNFWMNEKVIDYLGEVKDVRPIIKISSVYVLPSFYGEGTPRTILEAMAMGRPIITTDAPGCRETVINGKNGFLVPVKDSKALRSVMEKFIKKPELTQQMGISSRELAEKKYDVLKVNHEINKAMGLI